MKKIRLNTNPYIYNIDNVNVIKIKLLYPVKIKPRYLDIYKLHIMRTLMGSSSKKYNEIDLFNKVLDKNLVIKYGVSYKRFDNELFISVNYTIPKEGLVDNYNIENTFKLLYEFIYNPDVEDNKFTEKNFNWKKTAMLNNLKQEINNIYDLSVKEIDDFLDPDCKHFIHKEERIKLLEETTPENVYKYYEKNIKNNRFISFIYGKIDDKDKILELFNKYFNQKEYNFDIDVQIFRFIPFLDYQEKKIETKYNQSVIYHVYQVQNIKEKDEPILRMLYYFLYNKENALIFDTLRTNYNLVYECSVSYDEIHGLIYIRVLMDKKDKELINNLIKETIYSLEDKKVFNRCKDNLLRSLDYELLDDEDDDFYDVLIDIYKKLYYGVDTKDIIKKMKKIGYEQMKEFLGRFKLSRNLFMEGGHYDENL